jgi:GxxExxY protein
MDELLFKDEVFEIIGAAIEVHKELGNGFLEPVYQESLQIELALRNIPFVAQERLHLFYKGVELKKEYIPDFVCFGKIIVEIKALHALTNIEIAQLINYQKATKLRVGLLINFGSRGRLEWKRFVV